MNDIIHMISRLRLLNQLSLCCWLSLPEDLTCPHLAHREPQSCLHVAGKLSFKLAHLIVCLQLRSCCLCVAFAKCSLLDTDWYARRHRRTEPAVGQAASNLWWCCSRVGMVVLGSCLSESAWYLWWCGQSQLLQWDMLGMLAAIALKIQSTMLKAVVVKRWRGNSGAHNLWWRNLASVPRAARKRHGNIA